MDPDDFSVPGVVESPLGPEHRKKTTQKVAVETLSRRAQKRKKEDVQLVTYGAKKDDASLKMSAKHTSALAPVVNELAQLEKEIQMLFTETFWSDGSATGGSKPRFKSG